MSTTVPSPSLADNPKCSDWFELPREGRVILKTGKVEIGQGLATALVQIAADELDIAPDRIEIRMGHTALGPVEAGTSSSLSIETSGTAVRYAASALRHVIVAEAAKLLQAPVDALSVDDGRLVLRGKPTDLTYWTAAATADLHTSVLDAARPKPAGERRLAGRSLPRLDLPGKLAGAAFIHDLDLPGMMHGRVVQPPSQGRRIAAFDEAHAGAGYPDVVLVRDGSFVGVVAAREERAIKVAEQIARTITWTSGAVAPTLRAAINTNTSTVEAVLAKGDVETAPGRSIATEIERPYLAHASLAPSCAVATWRERTLEVYSHSQGVHDLRAGLAMAFRMDLSDVVVIHAHGAGTYGHSGQDDVAYEAALLARALPGRPVRVLWSRAADFALSPLGPGMLVRAEARVTPDGRIAALDVISAGQPHVHRPGRGGTVNFIAGERLAAPFPKGRPTDVPLARGGGLERNAMPLYAIPNLRIRKRPLQDLPHRTSALRALGGYANVFAVETLIDDIAHEIGADPVQLRLDHLTDPRAIAVIRTAAEMAGWPGERKAGQGLGIGFAQYKNRSAYCAVVARVVCEADVRLIEAWSAVDAGEAINPDGIINQVEGGIIQSASWTLKEQIRFEDDAVANTAWSTYPILRFSEAPRIAVKLIGRPDAPPLGVGETATGPTAAAIGNAVRQALGVRVRSLPLTREAVAAALR